MTHIAAAGAVVSGALIGCWHLWTSTLDAPSRRRILRWTCFSFVLHAVVAVGVHWSGASSYLGPDAGYYHRSAIELAAHWDGEWFAPDAPAGKHGFTFALAWMYRLFGSHYEVGLVFNAGLAAALIPITVDTTVRLFRGTRAHLYVPAILCLTPAFGLWPSQLLREALVLLLLAVVLNSSVRLTQRLRVEVALVGAGAGAALLTVRATLAIPLLVAAICGTVVGRRNLVPGLGGAAALAAGLAILVSGFNLGASDFEAASRLTAEDASSFRRNVSLDATSGYGDADVSSGLVATALRLPVEVPRFVLGPAPWQVSRTTHLPALVDAGVCWWLYWHAARAFRLGRRLAGRRGMALALPATAMAATLSVAIGNYGLLVRQRPQVLLAVVPLLALGLAVRAERRSPAPPPGELRDDVELVAAHGS